MPFLTQEQQTASALRHIDRKRIRAFAYLGGKCAKCGATERLEFDHVDPATKAFNVGKNLSRKWDVLREELDKCQLLCHYCHKLKTFAG